jgi:hypothetical protein
MSQSAVSGYLPASVAAALERIDEIESSLERYGCFDLVEEDVEWLIHELRRELRRRSAGT